MSRDVSLHLGYGCRLIGTWCIRDTPVGLARQGHGLWGVGCGLDAEQRLEGGCRGTVVRQLL